MKPVVDICGTPFYADAVTETFTEVANPGNQLFVAEMMNFDDHHEFLFNKETKRLADRYSPHNETVWLRPISATDPEGMEQLLREGKISWAEHYQTKLPKLNIGGTDFYIDEVRNAFRQVDNRWNQIPFSDVNEGHLFFDKHIKNVPFPHEFDPKQLPAHIIKVKMPSGYELSKMLQCVKKVSTNNPRKKGLGL